MSEPFLKTLNTILQTRQIELDDAQQHAANALQAFYHRWMHYRQRWNLLAWLKRSPAPQGIYLWGGVGRGKSFLMDCFYESVPDTKKSRWHFHAFMRRIHSMLGQFKNQPDPLVHVAKLMAQETRLLCFDEFHVSDIADAMILGRLFEYLFKEGVGVVLTSNYPPEALYPNGLQRQSFLPTIDLLKQHLQVVELAGGIDYRHRTLTSADLYYAPLTSATSQQLEENFQRLNGTLSYNQEPLVIYDRPIAARAWGEHVAWFDFHALCGTARSQHDYLELADRFDTLIISDIPVLSGDQSPEAIRFKWLIDILYDHRVKLMLSAVVAIEALCPLPTSRAGSHNEFSRTLSRLIEMRSDAYLHEAKRPVLDSEESLLQPKDNMPSTTISNTLAST